MQTIINLNNNYNLKLINSPSDFPIDAINIKSLTFKKVSQNGKLVFTIDFNELNPNKYKSILKKLLLIKKVISKSKIEMGKYEKSKKIIGYLKNYNENNQKQKDFILAINAILCNTRYERYNYIYDTVCNYLDRCFYGKNLCDFQNNKCGEKRETSSLTGCCHHVRIKCLGPFTKLVPCEYLRKDYTCGAKCISCKLFTCDYLEKKGIKFRIKDILLLDVFFNPLQKYFIKYMVFTPKDKIIKRLLIL